MTLRADSRLDQARFRIIFFVDLYSQKSDICLFFIFKLRFAYQFQALLTLSVVNAFIYIEMEPGPSVFKDNLIDFLIYESDDITVYYIWRSLPFIFTYSEM